MGRIILCTACFFENGVDWDGDGEVFDVRGKEVYYTDQEPVADILEWKFIGEVAWESIAVGFAGQNVLQ